MKRKYISNNPSNSRLIIFFTGWSTDYKILNEVTVPLDYDIICVWGYENLNWAPLDKTYQEIVIIGWSFGVAIANSLYSIINRNKNVTGVYAINGSRQPIDDNLGIPTEIFNATLNTLSERNLYKFRIRISGGLKKYEEASGKLKTDADLEQLRNELKFFADKKFFNHPDNVWDYVFISESDKIFPLKNLKESWSDTPHKIIQEEHLPDFQKIFNLIIKDKRIISRNFENSVSTYESNADIQKRSINNLISLLAKETLRPDDILEIGTGSGYLTRKILYEYPNAKITSIDISDVAFPNKDVDFIKGDAECVLKDYLSESTDLIVSGSTFQWLHSPMKVLMECNRILRKGATMAFSTYLTGTFQELTEVSGNSLLYLSEEQWKMLAEKAGFKIEVSQAKNYTLQFDTINDLFHHLKSTGVNGLGGKNKNVRELREIIRTYPMKEGKYPLTYVSYIMILKKEYKSSFQI